MTSAPANVGAAMAIVANRIEINTWASAFVPEDTTPQSLLSMLHPPDISLHYPQHKIERMVPIAQFLANRAFWTTNETLPPLK